MSEELAKPLGRPTIMTPEIISKLEEVFSLGGTDEEACFYANIGKSTLYNYQEKNPDFVDRKEQLKEEPILKARRTIIKALENPVDAKWYLEKKRKKEFGNTEEQNINILMPVLVKFLDKKDDEPNSSGDTKRIS